MTIRITTAEGTFDIPGTANDVETSNHGLKIRRQGQTIAHFKRFLHWHETPDNQKEQS